MKNTTPTNLILKGMSIFTLILLLLPLSEQLFQWKKITPLNGAFTSVDKPKWTIDAWFSGDFSNQSEAFLKENMGFQPSFVRLYNQLQYSLFDQFTAKGVIEGKEKTFFEKGYIETYLGMDFIGKDSVAKKIDKLQKISDTLSRKGIQLIVLIAPGKGTFYRHRFPKQYDKTQATRSNYQEYVSQLKNTSIHWLDFNQWFVSMKQHSSYPLFSKSGIHWSFYGETLAADSLIQYINTLGKKQVPKLIIEQIKTSKIPLERDKDLQEGMNLIFPIYDIELAYPKFKLIGDTTIPQPKVLTVSDSFYWGMFNWGLSRDGFSNGKFWYYNRQVYPDSYEKETLVEDLDMIKEVEKNDYILLISTDANLQKFAYGFIDQLYKLYYPEK